MWPEVNGKPDSLVKSEKDEFRAYFEIKKDKGKLDAEKDIKNYLKGNVELLLITPDPDLDIGYQGRVSWISWADVWDICEDLKEDGNLSRCEKNSIDEIQVAMEGEKLKPFRGFDEEFIDLVRKQKLPNKKDFAVRLKEKLKFEHYGEEKWYVEGKGIVLKFYKDPDPWGKYDLHYEVGIEFKEGNFWVGLDFEGEAKYESFEEFKKEFSNKIEKINEEKENWNLSGVPDLEPKEYEYGHVIRAEIPFENLTSKRLVSKIVQIIEDFEKVLPDLTERLG